MCDCTTFPANRPWTKEKADKEGDPVPTFTAASLHAKGVCHMDESACLDQATSKNLPQIRRGQ